jgi:alanine racemase
MSLGPYRCWVEISRSRLRQNYRAIQKVVSDQTSVCPVVKADAYRHGAEVVATILEQEGARWFAVSSCEEGIALRVAGIKTRILVMADFLPDSRDALVQYQLTPVIHHLDDLEAVESLSIKHQRPVRFHLKIDSGMGRLGTNASSQEIVDALNQVKLSEFEGLMSHFASASDYQSTQSDAQIARYLGVLRAVEAGGLKPKIVHMSSTIPIAYGRQNAWLDMVRPGHAIYGYVSPARGQHPDRALQVKPVLQWFASVLTTKHLLPGESIGYGAIYRADRPMTVAVISAGYADGIPHRLTNRGHVSMHGRKCPILGAVSMDVITVDVTEVGPVMPGDQVSLLNDDLDAQEIAREAGTISYAVLCGISARVKRVYVD